ncbi:DUF5302 domain-containing protein [Saxibacter everestensis]|uniref:DUF5302 domain-containing protein n=1 Tax=Saxibacter everestensis TaxID=2909229 RepID=A0ABY8QQT4_9MICO|nr:DUF5302 domain-containing protein [Brevibacteriaceae bacterium ZFBP1038]
MSNKNSKPTGPSEEMKKKFKEVLDAKNDRNTKDPNGPVQGDSKVHEAHGPADHKREFRRKSG